MVRPPPPGCRAHLRRSRLQRAHLHWSQLHRSRFSRSRFSRSRFSRSRFGRSGPRRPGDRANPPFPVPAQLSASPPRRPAVRPATRPPRGAARPEVSRLAGLVAPRSPTRGRDPSALPVSHLSHAAALGSRLHEGLLSGRRSCTRRPPGDSRARVGHRSRRQRISFRRRSGFQRRPLSHCRRGGHLGRRVEARHDLRKIRAHRT
ncbi:pentapeptide repeat-containing protein [Frankia sp. AiPa1]|uniref:pentapeptide repeat-containing protein n=1 Tax=Frankia sp. AiPa1 TaxID=573492 RepID=UPI0035A983BA